MKISRDDSHPDKPWYFRIPPHLSGTGKYVKKRFASKEEAQFAVREVERGVPDAREMYATLKGTAARDVLEAKKFQADAGLGNYSVLELLRIASRVVSQRKPEQTFAEACDAYVESRGFNLRTGSGKDYRITKNKFAVLADKQIQDLSPESFWEILRLIPNSTRRQHMAHLRAIFNYAIKKDYLALGQNPIDRLDMPKEPEPRAIQIYEVNTVARYLEYALQYELELMPYFTLGFFCGVRPEGEMGALEWSAVDWARQRLNIPPHVAKGRKRGRHVEIAENAMNWLIAYRERGGKVEGKVMKFRDENALRKARGPANKVAEVEWMQDGMRRSFASYHVALYDDVAMTSFRMGHMSTIMMGRHYLAGVPKEEGERYFKIRPGDAENVVPFRSAQ